MSGSKPPGDDQGGGCPMGYGAGGVPAVRGANDLTYNDYLKIPELLRLQIPQSEPAHHDELLFIIIHQAYELWFKLILHEMKSAIAHMQAGEVLRAQHFIKRVCEVMRVLVPQIHILETMTPADFLEFRDRLMPASGFQSLQFREVEFLAGLKDPAYYVYFKNRPEMLETLKRREAEPDLRSAYYGMLAKLGFKVSADVAARERAGDPKAQEEVIQAIRPVYQNPAGNLPLYLLTESLVEFDEFLGLWRVHHVRVVERVIGMKQGTGGSSGVEYLQSTTSKKCFPALWAVRTRLTK